MNGRQWKPGGGAAGPASTSNDRGLAPGKRTLVEGLNYGPPQRNVDSTPRQTKVAVGSPGDSHEQEADRVAEQVMSPGPVRQPIGKISPRIQQQADDHAEATVVAAVASSAGGGATGGIPLTGAAGAAADVRDEGAAANGEATGTPGVTKHAQFGPHSELVVMAKEVAGQTPRDRAGLADQLASTRGGGEAMPDAERSFFESRFGESFGDVQIHTGSDAAGMNAQLSSRAFTHQHDVYFGAGEYQPGSADSRRLLAHELTHVVQQTRGGAQGSVQRQEKDKDKDKGSPRPVGYTIRVPAKEVGKAQEFLVTTLAQAFGVSPARASNLIAKEGWHWHGGWAGPSDADVKVGYVDVVFEIAQYRQTQDKLKPAGDRDAGGRLQGAGAREAAMQRSPAGEQVPLNQEANRRFWARTGYKVGLPLGDSPEDREQAKLWFEIRDEMLAERDKLAALPPEIKSVLGGDGAIPPKDYEKALEVAGKLAKLDPKDRAMYQLHGLTDGLDELDRKLDRAAGKPGEATESPAEMSRLLQVFKDRVKDPQAKAEVRAEVEAARVKLARAKLIELKINEDPHLRARIKIDLAELAKKLTDGKIAATDEAGFHRTVQGYNITELVGEIGEALARESLRSGAGPGQVVLSNMEIVREVPGYKTISAWKAAEQAAGRPGDVGGLYEAGGKLWKSITEVDNMVVEQGAGGKLRVVDLEQTKVGGTHAAAAAQNTKAMAGLGEIAVGKTDVQIFDRVGKNKLGAQRTGEFDLSNLTSTGQHTRGLPGTGFDRKLPFDKITLEDLARQLLMEGLPDVWQPPPAVPPTGDRNHNRGEQK